MCHVSCYSKSRLFTHCVCRFRFISIVPQRTKSGGSPSTDTMTDCNNINKLCEDVFGEVLSFLDYPTMVQNKAVCRAWEQSCTLAIQWKLRNPPQAFRTTHELRTQVNRYMSATVAVVEEIATTYGWPINSWDVSNVADFSFLFSNKTTFNEEIGSWNVSNANTMLKMFEFAGSFNQDLSSWDVSNVTNMSSMFFEAEAFNQNISSWNVSQVTNMSEIFWGARAFNQVLRSWTLTDNAGAAYMFFGVPAYENLPEDLVPEDINRWVQNLI
jgi:surface protein